MVKVQYIIVILTLSGSSYILAISEGGNIIEGTPEFTPGLSGVRVT
jgi:hypothetical protein